MNRNVCYFVIAYRDGDANLSDVEGESGSRAGSANASSGTGLTSLGTSTVYSLIETAHPVFGKVKRLWNSPMESHREVSTFITYSAALAIWALLSFTCTVLHTLYICLYSMSLYTQICAVLAAISEVSVCQDLCA